MNENTLKIISKNFNMTPPEPCWRTIEVLLLKQPLILLFLYHKSANTCLIDLYKVSNSKLKPDLRNCVKIDIIEPKAPPQKQHKRGTIFGTLCRYRKIIKGKAGICMIDDRTCPTFCRLLSAKLRIPISDQRIITS